MDQTCKLLHDTVDALVAIKMDIQCAEEHVDAEVVLTAERARRACSDIDQSIEQLRDAIRRLGALADPGCSPMAHAPLDESASRVR